jgi:hypothetical protein
LWGAGRYGCTVAAVDIFYFLLIMDSVLSLSLDVLIHSETHDFVIILKQSNFPSAGNFVNSDDDETPYSETSFNFSYIDEMAFCSQYKNNDRFLIMSLNIQSLNSKFNDLRQLVSNMLYSNCAPVETYSCDCLTICGLSSLYEKRPRRVNNLTEA